MSKWTDHLKTLDPSQNWSGHLSYINSRSRSVLSQLNSISEVSFSIDSPNNIQTNSNIVEVKGKGWINVRNLRIKDSNDALSVQWLDEENWQVTLPASPGRSNYVIEALDFSGQVIGSDDITIISTSTSEPASERNIVVSEIMFNPKELSASEITQGFTDKDQFEFIEIMNISEKTTDLSGVRFTNGIDYEFESGTTLKPNERLVIPRERTAFLTRYPDQSDFMASGEFTNDTGLSNAGERLRLVDLSLTSIKDFSYNDRSPWPVKSDGEGFSLILIQPKNNPDHSIGENWFESSSIGGSPGIEDPNESLSDQGRDNDGDGLNQFAENVLGSSDDIPNSPLKLNFDAERHLIIRYFKRADLENTIIKLESSQNLINWLESSNDFTIQSESPTEEGTIEVKMRSLKPGESVQFLRLKIEREDNL